MSDRQKRFEGTRDVLEPHKFDVMRLDEYLKTAVENLFLYPLKQS